MTLKTTIKRFAIVLVLCLGAVEMLERLSVSRTESWNERGMLLIIAALIAGLNWAARPAFSRVVSTGVRRFGRAALVAALFVSAWAGVYFYCWHLRPNLGWYEEAEWVAKHEVFQKELRARVEGSLW